MNAQNFALGSRIEHAGYGTGTISFVGTDYLGIVFDEGGEALIRRDKLEKKSPATSEAEVPERAKHSWPASTFISEAPDTPHFLGSHWDPFVEDQAEIVKHLPEYLPDALLQTGYGEVRQLPHTVPDDWPKGTQLVWPVRSQGLALILRAEAEANMLVSLFPFFATGSQHTATLRTVTIWESGVEAQISVSLGDCEVTFFDSQFVINLAGYEAGKDYDFILSGLAYDARPAERKEWTINRHPDEVAWMNRQLKEGEVAHEATVAMTLDGAAIFLPITGWDVDDYSFHAPIKEVREFSDWLGQAGWRVRATVMRFGGEDVDLDILITRRAWSGETPPQVGQDIEGRLWLQGYLWMPKLDDARPGK